MKTISLNDHIGKALSTTQERIDILYRFGIIKVADFLEFYPRAYENLSKTTAIHELRADEKNVLIGSFVSVSTERVKGKMLLTKAIFKDENGYSLECVWFNQAHIKSILPLNIKMMISAKAKMSYGKISLQNPIFEEYGAGMINVGRISPVYREHQKLSSQWIRKKMFNILDIIEEIPNILPQDIINSENLLTRNKAIQEIHFPTNEEMLERAKDTLSFEELFILQTAGLLRKIKWQESTMDRSKIIKIDSDLQKAFFATLPFTLTDAQKIALLEILQDFEKSTPALRLLEGDVGSGKTVVALAASLPVLAEGLQVAFLAPTEVLANQHLKSIQTLLKNFQLPNKQKSNHQNALKDINVALLTGAVQGNERQVILESLRKGKIDILVGTHALIQDKVIWHNLGFVVIDEQHRFGVKQRETLLQQGAPHILQMTATPIPRTLAIVAFGDQDLSVINEMPKGRKAIITKVIEPKGRKEVEIFIKSEISKGRQGFVICPLVEDSDKIIVKSAVEEFERLKKEVFPDLRLELLHGRMKSGEKKSIMENFQNHQFDLLVSTAVVEVGVDIPNATIMLIEGAERFGLAQLHQFRGRVGRGGDQSYCFLFPSEEVNTTQRLRAMEKSNDGFYLAQIDLKLRGPGEVFGLKQSGIPDLKMASLFDARIISKARKAAEEYIEIHPNIDLFDKNLQKIIISKEQEGISKI